MSDFWPKFTLFLLSAYGLANAIAVLKIGRYFIGTASSRKLIGRIPYLGDLFYCPPCLAFWIGMGLSLWILSPASDFVLIRWQAALVDGLAASGAVYLIHVAAERLGHNLDL